jgi:cell division topological specificity factor
MSVLNYFRASQPQNSARVAKERLQIIVAHERGQRSSNIDSLLPKLQEELLDVVRKYLEINDDQIKMRVEKEGSYEVLEVNITLPEGVVN